MEILIGIAISTVTSLLKMLTAKFGEEMGRKAILTIVFVFSLAGAILYTKQVITVAMIESWASVVLMAVGWYKVVVETVITPAYNRFVK